MIPVYSVKLNIKIKYINLTLVSPLNIRWSSKNPNVEIETRHFKTPTKILKTDVFIKFFNNEEGITLKKNCCWT